MKIKKYIQEKERKKGKKDYLCEIPKPQTLPTGSLASPAVFMPFLFPLCTIFWSTPLTTMPKANSHQRPQGETPTSIPCLSPLWAKFCPALSALDFLRQNSTCNAREVRPPRTNRWDPQASSPCSMGPSVTPAALTSALSQSSLSLCTPSSGSQYLQFQRPATIRHHQFCLHP